MNTVVEKEPHVHVIKVEEKKVFPNGVSEVAAMIVTLLNRNDTPKCFEDDDNPNVTLLPVSKGVMELILGIELAHDFPNAIQDKATAHYFNLVEQRLMNSGISLAYSSFYWVICRFPRDPANWGPDPREIYNLTDLLNQRPGCFGLNPKS